MSDAERCIGPRMMHSAAALTYHALVPYLELRGVRTVGDLVRGRMAGSACLFMTRPSSVLLDLVSRAKETGSIVTLVYAPARGTLSIVRRVRIRALEGERYLICWDLEVEGERTYRLDRIMSLDDGQDVYLSPWAIQSELTGNSA